MEHAKKIRLAKKPLAVSIARGPEKIMEVMWPLLFHTRLDSLLGECARRGKRITMVSDVIPFHCESLNRKKNHTRRRE